MDICSLYIRLITRLATKQVGSDEELTEVRTVENVTVAVDCR